MFSNSQSFLNLNWEKTTLVHGNKAKLKRPSLALLQCILTFEIFEHGLIAVQITLKFSSLALLRWKSLFRAWPYCDANRTFEFSSLALLRFKLNFFEFLSLALLRCILTFEFSSLALLRCKSNFRAWPYCSANRTFEFWAWPYCGSNRTMKFSSLALLHCTSVYRGGWL